MKVFIVRLEENVTGDVTGVVERVRSGEKERFRGYAALGDLVKRMAAVEAMQPARSTLRIRDCAAGGTPPGSDR